MARKKKHPEHVNHERWLISYADFITLLFAFFVVMFAVSQVDSKKVGRFTEAFSKAVGIDVFPMTGDSLLAGGRVPDQLSDGPSINGIQTLLDEFHATLQQMISENKALQGLQVIRLRHELVLRLPEGVLFDSGDARVKDATSGMLKVLAQELAKRKLDVRVEGHTDNRPIASGRFHSNWDLSTARASAVMVKLLAEGMPPKRLSIAGYGEYQPIADNATEDGRKQNRRVDLVVTPMAEPPPEEAKDKDPAAAKESASKDAKGAPEPTQAADGKDTPESADNKAKDPAETKPAGKDSKDGKDGVDSKESKDSKDSKEPKDTKEPTDPNTETNSKEAKP